MAGPGDREQESPRPATSSAGAASPGGAGGSARSVLNLVDRISEVIYGLIVALSITGSVSLAGDGEVERATMLTAALGANVAWGIVDAVMYVLGSVLQRGRFRATARAVRLADAERGRRVLAAALPGALVAALTTAELEAIRRKVAGVPDRAGRASVARDDLAGGFSVFALVVLSTFPVTLPFLFVTNVPIALRTSNAVAVALLFCAGFALGRYAGFRPLRAGLTMMLVGAGLVGAIVSLGG